MVLAPIFKLSGKKFVTTQGIKNPLAASAKPFRNCQARCQQRL
ncbi:hypothetical protein MuYL_0641 [Mucilaginibacter xinganensis]|uniref:Uncharacterized protein n=1 Tax=Mucilaginibacter xinganensis TaxID=1234841 RepID=A0A223NS81_9SPHI|nr:hypothetical protein MuYL_0641 [Mucilaginibacter xinganensis]